MVGAHVCDELARAVIAGDVGQVTAVLAVLPACLEATTRDGDRMVSLAVRAGHEPVLRVLLQHGADPTWPEARAPRGSALHEAARAGRRDLVQLLLDHGADPSAHVEASGNAVFAAARDPELRALLESHGGTLDPYDLVWLDEDDEVLRRVTADAASAHAGCGGVYTAVVTRRKRDLLMRLLQAGVRVPPSPCGCRTYLLEDAEMLRALLEHGALDPDYPDEHGATLLHALCRPGGGESDALRARCAEVLLAAGADASARDQAGETPVTLARRHGWSAVVSVLEGVSGAS